MKTEPNFEAGFFAAFALNLMSFVAFSIFFFPLFQHWPLYSLIFSTSTSLIAIVSVFTTFRTIQRKASRLEEGGIFGEFPFMCSGITAILLWFFEMY